VRRDFWVLEGKGGGEEGELQEETYAKHRGNLFFGHFDFSISIFSPMLHTHSFIYQPRHIILANDGTFKQHT